MHYQRLLRLGALDLRKPPPPEKPPRGDVAMLNAAAIAADTLRNQQKKKVMELLQSIYNFLTLGGALQWRHRKRKTTLPYVQVGEATAQCSDWNIQEGDSVIVYLSSDGKLYVRHKEEFTDGRFYAVKEEVPSQ